MPTPVNGLTFTFDDGPHLRYTPKILNVLKKHKVKAVFCPYGAKLGDKRKLRIAKRIVKEGHTICNHSYTHPRFSKIKPWKQRWEIRHAQAMLIKRLGVTPTLFRPPEGVRTKVMRATIRKYKLKMFMWDIDSRDWRKSTHMSTIYNRVVYQWKQRRKAGKSSVVLFHDTNWKTARMLDKIITRVKKGP